MDRLLNSRQRSTSDETRRQLLCDRCGQPTGESFSVPYADICLDCQRESDQEYEENN